MTDAKRIVEEYYGHVIAHRFGEVVGMFDGEPNIDTPLQGPIRGREAFERYLERERDWLLQQQPGAKVLDIIESPERLIAEYVIYVMREGKRIDLPIATVADRTGDHVTAVRVYHTTSRIRGMHVIRDPLIPAANPELPTVVRHYMQAVEEADLDSVLKLFTEDAYLREPGGEEFKHQGRGARRRYFQTALASGGMKLNQCTATFDETRCAVEYVCDRWGGRDIDPQPGVAIYEIDPSGLLSAVRLYDDVKRPGDVE